ncbi:MAG: DNA primase, partial [Candidatus Tumulicola sp.]
MRFDRTAIAEIHARLDIARVIGEYVPLKKRGNDLVGLCPFHGEKTPSFHVHPDRGFFKCFGCGAGGDAIAFVQRIENVPFADAVRTLAAKAGVELEPENPGAARARTEREAIYEANRIAAAYFARMLGSDAGRRARAYCAQRGLADETAAAFALGYAPDSWSGLVDELERAGVGLSVAASAGLLKPGQRGYYDFYRDRLMVPTYSTTGEVIAFGGRALGDGEPKYLNTTTTPVYVKGRHLYALNVARRAAQADRTLIVVEGYLDCIALHQAGFKNTVAALGTAFTPEQATELRKYADYVFLCFDGDAAGSAAATKAVDIASKSIEHAGSAVRIVMLPPGDDPDGFVRRSGAEAFRKLLDDAKPAIAFRIDAEIERFRAGFESPAALAPKAEALIREMVPREEWDRWRVYVAGRLQVSADDLRNSRF